MEVGMTAFAQQRLQAEFAERGLVSTPLLAF